MVKAGTACRAPTAPRHRRGLGKLGRTKQRPYQFKTNSKTKNRRGRIFLGAGTAAAQEMEQQHDQADYQDDVNQAAGYVKSEKP